MLERIADTLSKRMQALNERERAIREKEKAMRLREEALVERESLLEARENVVRYNIFARGGNALTSVSRIEEGQISANYFNNIVLGPSKSLFSGGYKGNIAEGALISNANSFWTPGGRLPASVNPGGLARKVPARITWTEWKKAGHDSLSLTTDPGLTEGKKTWRLAKDSPALKLGFKSWDWSGCGPRPKSRKGGS